MLPPPSTPSSRDDAEVIEVSSGAALSTPWGYPSPSSSTSPLSPPVAPASHSHALAPSSPAAGQAHQLDYGLQSPQLTDEDQDMSEGGAPLSLGLAEEDAIFTSPEDGPEPDAEAEMLDADVMGQVELDELYLDTDGQASVVAMGPQFTLSASSHIPAQPSVDDFEDDMLYDELELAEASNGPAAMMEVSLQLEHLQGAHEIVDFLGAAVMQHGNAADHSIPPPLLPTPSSAGFESSYEHSEEDAAQAAGLALAAPSLMGPGSYGGFATSVGAGSSAPNQGDQPPVSHVHNLEMSWGDDTSEADQSAVEDHDNLCFKEFLLAWARTFSQEHGSHGSSKKTARTPSIPAIRMQTGPRDIEPVVVSDLQGDACDIQRINWDELGISRLEATKMRKRTYKNYTNLRLPPQWQSKAPRLPNRENYFKFRQMDFKHTIRLAHFQLRNLVACASRDHIYYAGSSKVMHYNPTSRLNPLGTTSVAMDLTDPSVQPFHSFSSGVQISAMTIDHDILIAGGFCGEYGMTNLRSSQSARHTEGVISDHPNSITNHVQVHLSRGSSLPIAAFSSNDNGLRLLDVNTNRFIAEHKYDHAINCSAISPDQRLRVLVGDCQNVMICNAETGEILQDLDGHRDFGFACDWADDGWTVATGNQDMQVKIWDARKWTNSSGAACPVASISAAMAGVRKLKFSPAGSGKRVLVAAEPADIISVINARTFETKQTLNFFGQVAGVDFTNDGHDLYVGICDKTHGGIMQFERCDFASSALAGLEERSERRATRYERDAEDESFLLRSMARGPVAQERMPAMLGATMGFF